MRCVVCKQAETYPGTATVTVERDAVTLAAKDVPARVCLNCGEAYVDQDVATRLRDLIERREQAGVRVDIRYYVAA